VSPGDDLAGRRLILLPHQPIWPDGLSARIAAACAAGAHALVGPRAGSVTDERTIPDGLPPHDLRELVPLTVTRVESLRPGLVHQAGSHQVSRWLEHVTAPIAPVLSAEAPGSPGVVWQAGGVTALTAWPDEGLLLDLVGTAARAAGLAVTDLGAGLRLRRRGDLLVAINHDNVPVCLADHGLEPGAFVLGGDRLDPGGVAIWREDPA
jgi:beta-galactosidase